MEPLPEAASARFTAIERDLELAWLRFPVVPAPVRMQMTIAVAEVVGNIISHAGGMTRPLRIDMDLVLSETGQVHVCFTDDGDEMPAEVDLSTVSMPDATAERGRGLALARAVLEQLWYFRHNAVNYWTLVSRPYHAISP